MPTTPELDAFYIRNAMFGVSERFRTLDRLEAYYKDLQDDWKDSDWSGRKRPSNGWRDPQPVTEMWAPEGYLMIDRRSRRPTVRYNLARLIVDRVTDLLFAEGRFPDIRVENNPGAEEWLRKATHDATLSATMIQARTIGGSTGTSVVTFGFREGRLRFQVHNPKHVEPLGWKDKTTFIPTGIRIRYVYPTDEFSRDEGDKGQVTYKRKWRWYQREISSTQDVVFDNPELTSKPPEFTPVEIVDHDYGFFPGVWIQNKPCEFGIDGFSDFEDLIDLFDHINMMASQLDRTLQYSGDPQLILKLQQGHEMGAISKSPERAIPLLVGEDAAYLEIAGAAVQRIQDQIKDMRSQVFELAGIVSLDPEKISGAAQSAKALEYLFQPTLAVAGKHRIHYGQHGVVALAELVMKAAIVHIERGEGTAYEGAESLAAVRGRVVLRWPQYFSPTLMDIEGAVRVATSAVMGGMISEDTAREWVAPYFGVRDVEQETLNIEAAKKKRDMFGKAAREGMEEGELPPSGEGEPGEGGEGGRFKGPQ